ncbi:MAG TPA: TIGR04222 domain-containing membrane protein [Spirillospora sp.]
MADDISGAALGLLAAYFCLGLGVLALQLVLRARLRRGRPPAREPGVHELACLRGGDRRAIAVSIAALRLDHAVDAFADGRLLASRPGGDRPRTASAPLDEAVFEAIAEGRAVTLDDLAGDRGVEAELGRLRAGLVAQGLLTDPRARRRLVTVQAVMLVWVIAGLKIFIEEGLFSGVPGVLVPVLVLGPPGLAGLAFGAGRKPTREGARVAERHRRVHARLDPGNIGRDAASRDSFTAGDFLLGLALHGAPAVRTFDPDFARTSGLDRYLETGQAPDAPDDEPGGTALPANARPAPSEADAGGPHARSSDGRTR